MELFLNLLWLIIAAGALIAFGGMTGQEKIARPQRRQAWIALTCVLVLLFFAISMTDDLHQDAAFIEEAGSYKRHSGTMQSAGAEHNPHAIVHYAAVASMVPRILPESPLCFASILSLAIAERSPSPRAFVVAGRAPPFSSL